MGPEYLEASFVWAIKADKGGSSYHSEPELEAVLIHLATVKSSKGCDCYKIYEYHLAIIENAACVYAFQFCRPKVTGRTVGVCAAFKDAPKSYSFRSMFSKI